MSCVMEGVKMGDNMFTLLGSQIEFENQALNKMKKMDKIRQMRKKKMADWKKKEAATVGAGGEKPKIPKMPAWMDDIEGVDATFGPNMHLLTQASKDHSAIFFYRSKGGGKTLSQTASRLGGVSSVVAVFQKDIKEAEKERKRVAEEQVDKVSRHAGSHHLNGNS